MNLLKLKNIKHPEKPKISLKFRGKHLKYIPYKYNQKFIEDENTPKNTLKVIPLDEIGSSYTILTDLDENLVHNEEIGSSYTILTDLDENSVYKENVGSYYMIVGVENE